MDKLEASVLNELFGAIGDHLRAGGHSAAIVVVGGSALAARGWVSRVTTDVDVIAQARLEGEEMILMAPDPLPAPLSAAIARVARDYGMSPNWLNTTVGQQWPFGLPTGFADEVQWVEHGGLRVGFAGRRSLIALKLYAAADGGPTSVHIQDLLALSPTDEELTASSEWVAAQDAGEPFGRVLDEVVEHVRRYR